MQWQVLEPGNLISIPGFSDLFPKEKLSYIINYYGNMRDPHGKRLAQLFSDVEHEQTTPEYGSEAEL